MRKSSKQKAAKSQQHFHRNIKSIKSQALKEAFKGICKVDTALDIKGYQWKNETFKPPIEKAKVKHFNI